MKGIKYANGTLTDLGGKWLASTVDHNTGKQQRKRFRRKIDAERFLEKVRDGVTPLSEADLVDAAQALRLLRAAGSARTLSGIVHEILSKPEEVKHSLAEAASEYITSRETAGNLSDATMYRYRRTIKHLVEAFPEANVDDFLGNAKLEKYVMGYSTVPKSRHTLRSDLSAFFSFCIKRKMIRENPVSSVPVPRLIRGDVEFYTIDEVKKILVEAKKSRPDMLPYLVLGFFAGLRPMERYRMTVERNACTPGKERWAEISITPDVGKGGEYSVRVFDTHQRLRDWMWLIEDEGHDPLSGRIVTMSFQTLGEIIRGICKRAGVRRIKDGARHTFATYHFAAFSNSALTAKICGHSETVALKHYRGRVGTTEGEKYFNGIELAPGECGLYCRLEKLMFGEIDHL